VNSLRRRNVPRARLDKLTETVTELADAEKHIGEQLGNLSDRLGYGLEDVARVMLPAWLERHLGLRVGQLERRFVKVEGEELELNLYGEGLKGKRSIILVGEAKSTIHPADVEKFAGRVEKLRAAAKDRLMVPVMFGYLIYSAATVIGRRFKIHLIASYQT
jgi:hypothetical protein